MAAPASISRLARLAFTLALLAACGAGGKDRLPAAEAPSRPPIVLLTVEGLRADMVDALGHQATGLTPHLDRFAAEATWAGSGVAPSTWTGAALASLMTGLDPWKHQMIDPERPHLRRTLPTLAETLHALGYHTFAYRSGRWTRPQSGLARGFERFDDLERGGRAAGHLQSLGAGAAFLWIHLRRPQAPYERRDDLLSRLGGSGGQLPERIDLATLERYANPASPPSASEAAGVAALYRLGVAWTDEQVGRFLDALQKSGQWDRTLIAVTSTQGQMLGEGGDWGAGSSLHRRALEVPLLIKLPRSPGPAIAAAAGSRVAAARLWATLVEAAGGEAPPATAPSLFRPEEGSGALSELYRGDGFNQLSFVLGDEQLLWTTPFAAGAFPVTPPLTGAAESAPRLELLRWTSGGVERVDDPARRDALAARLAARWHRFLERERTPAEEARR